MRIKAVTIMKKILILGGTAQQIKLVEAAKKMGVYTIVTDYLVDSPAKKVADEAWMLNIKDVDQIVERCKQEQVNGVICGYIDPCQRPYQQICDALDLPCYGTKDQFFYMTDKHAFKKMCMENGVDVIPEYTEEEALSGQAEFPLFVKPVDSRGSRGQSVCYTTEQLENAINFAKSESSNGDILIEKYMKGAHEFQVTYFFVDGEAYLIRTVDSYCGSEANHLEKVVACAVSPSRFTDEYLKIAHQNVVKMFKAMRYKNGPIFMQGFEDNGKFRFFDPGLRFPGVDYERVYTKEFGIDLMEAMVHYALEGNCGSVKPLEDGVNLNGKRAAVLFPTLKAGKVAKMQGFDRTDNCKVVSLIPRCEIGSEISWSYDVNQRMDEVDILCADTEDLKSEISKLQDSMLVFDELGNNMQYEKFSVDRIL